MSITLEDAKARIEPLAAANPDKGAACQYFYEDNTPCCIVGVAFENELKAAGIDRYRGNGTGILVLEAHEGIDLGFEREALQWLDKVQGRQDAGWSWGAAVEYANEYPYDSTDYDEEDPF